MPEQIPPELMALMQGGGQSSGGGAPGAGAAGGPVSAPMSTPQKNEGETGGAKAQVQMAVEILEQTLQPFGSDSDEGKAILDVLKKLGSVFGEKKEKARGLIPSEIMNLVASMPKGMGQPPGGAPQPGAMTPGMPQPAM